jgi:integrase
MPEGPKKPEDSVISALIEGRVGLDGRVAPPAAEVARARAYVAVQRSKATRDAYQKAWKLFGEWSYARGAHPERANPAVVAVFLAWMADQGYAPASIELYVAGVRARLEAARGASWPPGRAPQEIADVLRGIRRALAARPVDRKLPITKALLLEMLPRVPGHPIVQARSRAMLLVGFAGALRVSELCQMKLSDVVIDSRGLTLRLPTSKTDPEGRREEVKGILRARRSYACPVSALENWLHIARIEHGFVWRRVEITGQHAPEYAHLDHPPLLMETHVTRRQVEYVIKESVRALGKDPADYATHSLRAGLVTTAAEKGRSLDAIMRQTGHRSVEEARRYIRHGSVFVDNVTEGLFD